MYKVIKLFTDLQDNNYAYQVGDTFPRPGLEVSEARIRELSGYENRHRAPLIVWEEDKKKRGRKAESETGGETGNEPVDDTVNGTEEKVEAPPLVDVTEKDEPEDTTNDNEREEVEI